MGSDLEAIHVCLEKTRFSPCIRSRITRDLRQTAKQLMYGFGIRVAERGSKPYTALIFYLWKTLIP